VRFRSKVREIEAEQWFPGKQIPGVSVEDPYRREGWAQDPGPPPGLPTRHFVVTIHRQRAYLDPGDWVVPESDGEHHQKGNLAVVDTPGFSSGEETEAYCTLFSVLPLT
jgi:hypothetical protein